MLNSPVMRALPLLGVLIATALAAAPPADPAFARELEAWRAERVRRLTTDNGWLTVVGLDFIAEGENSVGSDPAAAVPLPAGMAPAKAGSFLLEKGVVRLKAAADSGLTLNGQPVTDAPLRSDADGQPDLIRAGRVGFYLIRRGGRFAVRVKDPRSAALQSFQGLRQFPADAAYRVTATFEPYPEPRTVDIPTVLGTTEPMKAPGLVRFRLGGKALTLEPVQEDGDSTLFFILADGTTGRETYPGGRFLYAAGPKDGKVVLDFNRAENPPCAFTAFATCPLPPARNRLKVRIPAGEKTYGKH
jgi:uncharacterized protein